MAFPESGLEFRKQALPLTPFVKPDLNYLVENLLKGSEEANSSVIVHVIGRTFVLENWVYDNFFPPTGVASFSQHTVEKSGQCRDQKRTDCFYCFVSYPVPSAAFSFA